MAAAAYRNISNGEIENGAGGASKIPEIGE